MIGQERTALAYERQTPAEYLFQGRASCLRPCALQVIVHAMWNRESNKFLCGSVVSVITGAAAFKKAAIDF